MGGGAPTFVAGSRLVSNAVSNQATTLFGPTDINTVDQNGLSDFGYTWGQFLDHDMDLTPTQRPATASNIPRQRSPTIPVDPVHTIRPDPIGSLLFTRSMFDPATGTDLGKPAREQINVNTSFLDLSQVYGSTQAVSDALRTGSGGQLKSSPGADGIIGTADDLLPFNTTDRTSPRPRLQRTLGMGNDVGLCPAPIFSRPATARANETTELTSLQTLFMRNHNAIASQLATLNPTTRLHELDRRNLFNEARKLNIAQYQNIIYTGYLPALLGPTAMPAYTGYNARRRSVHRHRVLHRRRSVSATAC